MKLKLFTKKPIKYLSLGVLAIVIIISSYFFSDYLLTARQTKQIEKQINQKNDTSKLLTYKNKNGQEWHISNPGKNTFTIGGKIKEGPEIVKAEIDPLKVSIGQTQTMKLELNSSKDISKVVAEITTDHKTITVELKKVDQRELTYDDVKNKPFAIKDNGELVLASDQSPANKFVYDNLINKFFERAKAANTVHYSFAGNWVVHDTGETTYTTKFIAYDVDNKSNNVTLAWSDPCDLPASNKITTWPTGITSLPGRFVGGNFYFENTSNSSTCDNNQIPIIGVEDVNYTIRSNFALTLSSQKLVFTPGKSIIIENGAYINLPGNATTKIARGYIWVNDGDGDSYFGSSYYNGAINYTQPTIQFSSTNYSPGSTYVRKTTVTDAYDYAKYSGPIMDCDDSNGNYYEYQTGYTDADNDDYAPSGAQSRPVCSGSYYFPSGYARSATPYDQYDSGSYSYYYYPNASYYDGSSGYNTTWGWDFNGNGSVEKLYNSLTGSTGCTVQGSSCVLNGSAGWEGSVPACGASGTFYDSSSCSYTNGCAGRFGHTIKQSCR